MWRRVRWVRRAPACRRPAPNAAASRPTAVRRSLPEPRPSPQRGRATHLARGADGRDDAVHGNGLAFLHRDLEQRAGGRRRNLGVDLVGRDLEERLVAIDGMSPTFLIQRTIVPSAIDSPIWGITTGVDINAFATGLKVLGT